ncbi:hypothetical protein A3I34_00020 [Candidatus Jorgensenbacteria bacterium RIFCSPLOWO2_02_FULL_45_12]|uniref:DUF86 domain-containing protein n=2 Tax=Candidatus Joergenseniibacteriota TaxID=1752739 RepID=A0A1F6BR37_9BACT|nr:MAG: hypothetical protein UX22_C0028G0013 [Candidatus Jorgensenbacteria bacterium GW2011_GWA2_45_9]OGG39232.1 MAG: hypothetical protein A3D55_01030 [Candidatus Jorgensenbacteria bacterium RIFCSPHIGHO2_02_FULL_45_20]OGG42524.1 MAG: hypothetical protein A3I34_00020 [Candidatus Jorgensenbacteria bacterium RIFCSPLOWO2_02_FULL_45_12]
MNKQPRIFLEHILESIGQIEIYTTSISKEEFESSIAIQDAVLRRLEIIGEAVKHLPDDFKEKHGSVPWKKIAGTRDFLTHEYFDVDIGLVWGIIQQDICDLREKIKEIVASL